MKQNPLNASLQFFEERLAKDLAEVERRIAMLEAERSVLRRQIAMARVEQAGTLLTPRKNSLNRVLAEAAVIRFLKKKKTPQHTRSLYLEAKLTNIYLLESTFRTYLHRMKNKGIIKNVRSGVWILSSDPE